MTDTRFAPYGALALRSERSLLPAGEGRPCLSLALAGAAPASPAPCLNTEPPWRRVAR